MRVKKRGRPGAATLKKPPSYPRETASHIDPCSPASNGHRGWNCRWRPGNSYESNKESLRHKSQVRHLRASHLPPRAGPPAPSGPSGHMQGASRRRRRGPAGPDGHLSPLRPSHWQINRGDRQSFCITSTTIALYIFYQRNRLPGPPQNPRLRFIYLFIYF